MFRRKTELLQFGHDALQDRQSLLPFLFRKRRRRFVIFVLDQLTGRGNTHAAKQSFRLAHVNLFRRKINVRVEMAELRLLPFSFHSRKRQGQLRVAQIDRVQKWLVMQKRAVINVERNFADERERVLAVFVIVNAHVARDQTAKWIEREMADRGLHAVFSQFFHNKVTPLPAESFAREIPAAGQQRGDEQDNKKAPRADEKPTCKS